MRRTYGRSGGWVGGWGGRARVGSPTPNGRTPLCNGLTLAKAPIWQHPPPPSPLPLHSNPTPSGYQPCRTCTRPRPALESAVHEEAEMPPSSCGVLDSMSGMSRTIT